MLCLNLFMYDFSTYLHSYLEEHITSILAAPGPRWPPSLSLFSSPFDVQHREVDTVESTPHSDWTSWECGVTSLGRPLFASALDPQMCEPILTRLPPQLDATQELKVLTFLSCVGMLMNNDYVVYENLRTLIGELPFSQARLQVLQIQSRIMLPKVLGASVWRLADDIPYRMAPQPPKSELAKPATAQQPEQEAPEQPVEDVQGVDLDEETPPTPPLKSRCLPVNTNRLWSEEDLGFIQHHGSLRDEYMAYVKKCQAAGIPARNLPAFKRRRNKILEEQHNTSPMASPSAL